MKQTIKANQNFLSNLTITTTATTSTTNSLQHGSHLFAQERFFLLSGQSLEIYT